jgi:hypothetical protein
MITGAIKALFKEAAKVLLSGRDDEPKPQKRKAKGGDTEGFGTAARVIMLRDDRLPEFSSSTTNYLFATLDWLNPFHNEHDNFVDIGNTLENPHSDFPALDL